MALIGQTYSNLSKLINILCYTSLTNNYERSSVIMKLLSIIYYLGIFVCGIQGSQKSCNHHKFLCFPASFLSALGGGLLRDLFILFVFPVAFTKICLPEVTIAICAGFLYRKYLQKHTITKNILKPLVTLIDSLALGTFIAIGINRALDYGANPIIALFSGITTALGGGILSSLLCGQSIYKILTTNIYYRFITILGAIIYTYSLTNDINKLTAQYILILYTLIFIMISNYGFKTTLIKYQTEIFQFFNKVIISFLIETILNSSDIQYIYSTQLSYSFNKFDYLKKAELI